ncbi:duf1337 domain-containing protein [Colletotrichum musicola]|uniref:Duf1337 domain-containing protein n=1 Tax=Colletotrichum musicola TaxID=2175873 RepID=A0A8H6ND37_9PEZI|nr:duf1337 domain-containing protein [Colletotrichum musicola]
MGEETHSSSPAAPGRQKPAAAAKDEAAQADPGDAAQGQADDAAEDKEFEEASAVVARHIKLLREYNQIKDVGQQLMGIVAENRGVTVGSLYKSGEFGVGLKD